MIAAMDRGRIRASVGWLVTIAVLLFSAASARADLLTTANATGITSTSARLNGLVDPSGTGSSWFFQYSTSSDMRAASATGSQAADSGLTAVSQLISQLAPSTTYYFRIVLVPAAGPSGTVANELGTVSQFATAAAHNFGVMSLGKRMLSVSRGGIVTIPLRCRGQAGVPCVAQLKLTHTRGNGRPVTCASAGSRVVAPHSATVRVRLSAVCRQVLSQAPRHRLGSTLHASFRGGQAKLVRGITLLG
jgi:hypothetical protein